MKSRFFLFVAFVAFLSLTPLRAATKPVIGDEAPAARAYINWVFRDLADIQKDMPQITAAAELAADPFIAGKNLGVRGGVGLNQELGGRAGGFVVYRGEEGKPGDIILYAFGVVTTQPPANNDPRKALETELIDAEKLKAGGSVVIGIASVDQLKSLDLLDRAKKACSALLDNHAQANDGLFKDKSGHYFIPTFVTANPIVAWTWSAELFAACTRRGKTPAMYQSISVDTKMVRFNKYLNHRFHDDIHVAPQPPGKLGHAYLAGLKATFTDVGTTSWPMLAEASDRAAGAIEDGGKGYLFLFGHYPPFHTPGVLAHDPGVFVTFNPGDKKSPAPGSRDDVVALGYCWGPNELFNNASTWGDPDKIRRAGRGVAWVYASYNAQPGDFGPREIVVDQCWARGDAQVAVPGYDIKILPPSGVVGEAMRWMITAQVWREVEEHNAAVVKH